MYFMEFVLVKARVLRVLSVCLSSGSPYSNEEAIIDITEYPRASPDAQVIFMGRESANNCVINTPTTAISEVEETQIIGSRLVDDAPSCTRHWLDLEAVAQLEHLEEALLKAHKEQEQDLKDWILELKEMAQEREVRMNLRNTYIRCQEYFKSTLKLPNCTRLTIIHLMSYKEMILTG